jgi:hypothetical protein
MREVGNVARMGRRRLHLLFWCESQKERGHSEDINIDGKIILRCVLERKFGMVWTRLIWLNGGLL